MSRVFAHQPAHSPHVWGLTPRGNTVGCAFPLALSLIPKRVVLDSYQVKLGVVHGFVPWSVFKLVTPHDLCIGFRNLSLNTARVAFRLNHTKSGWSLIQLSSQADKAFTCTRVGTDTDCRQFLLRSSVLFQGSAAFLLCVSAFHASDFVWFLTLTRSG